MDSHKGLLDVVASNVKNLDDSNVKALLLAICNESGLRSLSKSLRGSFEFSIKRNTNISPTHQVPSYLPTIN